MTVQQQSLGEAVRSHLNMEAAELADYVVCEGKTGNQDNASILAWSCKRLR